MIELVGAVPMEEWKAAGVPFRRIEHEGLEYVFVTGSRNRWVSPNDDNFGFSRWANDYIDQLITLGTGRHYGEWWGAGVGRGYGLTEKRFSLFNVARWTERPQPDFSIPTEPVHGGSWAPACCHVVPTLYRGNLRTDMIEFVMDSLRTNGSRAAPGFMRPEGVIVYHTAARTLFKATLEKDEEPKSKAAE